MDCGGEIMNRLPRNNKGVTLIELISAIAILSIVAFSAFTLLMFSIRSHNFIMSGSSAAQDADLLNKRLELLFTDSVTVELAETDEEKVITLSYENGTEDETTLCIEDGNLVFTDGDSNEVWQENLSDFKAEPVGETGLLKVSYTIGNRSFMKLFRVSKIAKTSQ